MLRQLFNTAVAAVLLAGPASAADKPADPTKTNLPVELRLVAKKDSYKTTTDADALKQQLKDAETTGKYPPAPTVDLVLEIRNKSDKPVKVWVSGDPVTLNLKLEGKGATSVMARKFFTREFRLPKPVEIPAGKTHEIPITKLEYGFRGASNVAYWTEAGEYDLSATFVTGLSPAPEGTKADEEGFARVTLASNKVKLKVEGK